MNKYKNLEFFTKEGHSSNFNYNEDLQRWEGDIYIPKISTDLVETEHLFIYERMMEGEIEQYAKPHIYDYVTSKSISIEWEDDTSPELSLYSINENKFIEKLTKVEIELDYLLGDTYIEDLLHTSLVTKEYIQINLLILSDAEGLFDNYLYIKDINDGHIIAKLYIYGEVEGEDERLKVLCENLGYFITPEDEKIFSDSDIEEALVDKILLNRKRKEILLEGSNIYPFIGSYKGLINAINFFGFDDLTIREYWRNVNSESKNFGKYKHSEVLEIFNSDVNLNTKLINTANYKKTNRLALVYQMYNVYEDTLDKYDLPTIKETFRYTVEEVLIKLFSLKEKLKKSFLPINIEIRDIISEGVYFTKLNKTYTTSTNTTLHIDKGVTPKIELLTNNNLILDLRDTYDLITQYDFDDYFEHDIRNRLDETSDDWGEFINALFTDYYPTINKLENLPDKDDIPIGCPIVLKNTSFDYAIKDLDVIFKDLNQDSDYVIDFEIVNPSIGDAFILHEKESDTKIEFNVTVAITEDALTEELFTLFSSQTVLPWVLFLPYIVIKDGKKYLRIEAKDIASSFIKFEFDSYVLNGYGNRVDDKFNKYFITLTNNNTIKAIGQSNYYEIEWRVYKTDLSFDYSIRGSLEQYESLAIVLTKQGIYNVDIKLYDTNNKVTRKLFENVIDVKMKKADFLGVYRRISDKYESIKSLDSIQFKENKLTSIKPLIIQETQLKDCNISFKSLDRVSLLPNSNYSDDYLYTVMNFRPNQDINFPGPFTFAAMGKDMQMKDFKYITNKWTMLSGDTPASFDIKEVVNGGVLVINNYLTNEKGYHLFHTSDLETAIDELNNNTDSIIGKYVYSYINNDEGFFPDSHLSSYIHVAGKYTGHNCDFKSVEFENIVVENIVDSTTYGYQINDFEILNNFRAFDGVVYIQFSPDNAKIPGKKFYKWSIDNITIDDFDKVYFYEEHIGFLFYKKGKYKIELYIEDNEGNTTEVIKNMILIK